MWFSWKNSNFWLFFVNNSENLRLGEKTKKTFLELNILYVIKVTIKIFCDYFSSYSVWKTAKKPPNWTVRNRRFSKNIDIFHHFMLLLLPMPLFLNLQWEYVLQITDKHLYTMLCRHFLKKLEQKWNLADRYFGLCLHFLNTSDHPSFAVRKR